MENEARPPHDGTAGNFRSAVCSGCATGPGIGSGVCSGAGVSAAVWPSVGTVSAARSGSLSAGSSVSGSLDAPSSCSCKTSPAGLVSSSAGSPCVGDPGFLDSKDFRFLHHRSGGRRFFRDPSGFGCSGASGQCQICECHCDGFGQAVCIFHCHRSWAFIFSHFLSFENGGELILWESVYSSFQLVVSI